MRFLSTSKQSERVVVHGRDVGEEDMLLHLGRRLVVERRTPSASGCSPGRVAMSRHKQPSELRRRRCRTIQGGLGSGSPAGWGGVNVCVQGRPHTSHPPRHRGHVLQVPVGLVRGDDVHDAAERVGDRAQRELVAPRLGAAHLPRACDWGGGLGASLGPEPTRLNGQGRDDGRRSRAAPRGSQAAQARAEAGRRQGRGC